MTIEEVTTTELVQRCTKCESENRILLDDLEVGLARESQADARVVPLPPCPTCRATEFLFQSPDDEPAHPTPGSFGHLHRLLVDHVHAELVKREKVIPQLLEENGRPQNNLARPIAPEAIARWFDRGLKIARPLSASTRADEAAKKADR
jgi:hypothetical protein